MTDLPDPAADKAASASTPEAASRPPAIPSWRRSSDAAAHPDDGDPSLAALVKLGQRPVLGGHSPRRSWPCGLNRLPPRQPRRATHPRPTFDARAGVSATGV